MSKSKDAGYTEPLALLREASRFVAQQGEIVAKGIGLDHWAERVEGSGEPSEATSQAGRDSSAVQGTSHMLAASNAEHVARPRQLMFDADCQADLAAGVAFQNQIICVQRPV